jgi:hypothetical protein
MKQNTDHPTHIGRVSRAFNMAASVSRVAAYGALIAGMTGFVTGWGLASAQAQRNMLVIGLAALAAQRAFNFTARQIEQFRRDIYYRDHGNFDWYPGGEKRREATLYHPDFKKNTEVARTEGQADVIDLRAARRARANSSPNF